MNETPPHRVSPAWRLLALAMTLVAVALAGLVVRLWLQQPMAPLPSVPGPPPPAEPPPDRLDLIPASFSDLPGWSRDTLAEALPALRRSCARRLANPSQSAGFAGTGLDWRPFCQRALRLGAGDHAGLRTVAEEELRPALASNNGVPEGLFTGYYEPELRGSRSRSVRFRVPLYRNPGDILRIDLGDFSPDLAGRKFGARRVGNRLEPYWDRAAIEGGALARRGLELVWVDDPIDAFFLQIQGSGRVSLAQGGALRVGYAGGNGHAYYAIGKELIARGVPPADVSMQSIRRYLLDHPSEADAIMNKNPSFVFFQKLDGEGPLGSEGVALTPGRSLAVDRTFFPMGLPVFVAATAPHVDPTQVDQPFERLLVAQDTGGAIKGPVRGDVFWGHGAEAAEIAGRMKNRGRLWVLVPKGLGLPTVTTSKP